MVDAELAAMLAHDERHRWYRGRRRILRAQLDRPDLPAGGRILDAGCGSGRMLDELAAYGNAAGIDVDVAAVRAPRELRRVARPGAALVITVPAYPLLWSAHDERNLHYRRYRRSTLRRSASAAGWRLVRDTHFSGALLAPAALVRLATRHSARCDLDRTPRHLDRALELPLRAEAALLRRGGGLSFGLSILAVFAAPPRAARAPVPASARELPVAA